MQTLLQQSQFSVFSGAFAPYVKPLASLNTLPCPTSIVSTLKKDSNGLATVLGLLLKDQGDCKELVDKEERGVYSTEHSNDFNSSTSNFKDRA